MYVCKISTNHSLAEKFSDRRRTNHNTWPIYYIIIEVYTKRIMYTTLKMYKQRHCVKCEYIMMPLKLVVRI